MANNKFYGYTPKRSKSSKSVEKSWSGEGKEGNAYVDMGNRLDRLNPYEFRKGMDYELTTMGCSRLAESTVEEREKATESVLKNLEENGGYYTSLITYESLFRNVQGVKPSFKAWLKEQDDRKMQEIPKGLDRKNVTSDVRSKKLKTPKLDDQMTEPKNNKEEYTIPFKGSSPLKEAIKKQIKSILSEKKVKEQDDIGFDDDETSADKAATKGAKKSKSKGNRFDLEKEAIKDLLYRGKKGKDSEYTEEEPDPKSILAIKDKMLQIYRDKFKGIEGGIDQYNALLKKENEKLKKIIEKHVKTFGEEGKGNNVDLKSIYGEKLPDTIKLLGARIKVIETEEQEELATTNELRREVAMTDMTRAQHIKLLEICRKHGVPLREGAMGVKQYYEIAKEAYLEGLSNGLKL